MKKLAPLLFALGTAWIATSNAEPNSEIPTVDEQALKMEARDITQQYAHSLQKTLKASIMTSGPASAIKACQVHAPGISAQTAQLTGWEVRRTSNKVRNPGNRPDIWEVAVLSNFEKKIKKGAPIENLEHSEVVNLNGKPVYRYMKAIPVKNLCLNCHGPHIAGPVKSAIKNLFPTDQATGYREGELRGAFSLKKAL